MVNSKNLTMLASRGMSRPTSELCKRVREEFDMCMKIRGVDDSCYHILDALRKCEDRLVAIQNNRAAESLELIR